MTAKVKQIKRKPMKSGKVSNYKKALRRPTKANFKRAKKTAKKR